MADTNIKFEQPISLYLEVIEADDRVPSMRIASKILVKQFQHQVLYEGHFWIECKIWDAFTSALFSPSAAQAVLGDMSGRFMLAIRRANGKVWLDWKFAKSDVGSDSRHLEVSFASALDDDMLSIIRQQFREFLVWW